MLYAWDVLTKGPHGECGVTDDRRVAMRHVHQALKDAEAGALGKIVRVTVSSSGRVEYVVLGMVARAMRDEVTGAIVWAD